MDPNSRSRKIVQLALKPIESVSNEPSRNVYNGVEIQCPAAVEMQHTESFTDLDFDNIPI